MNKFEAVKAIRAAETQEQAVVIMDAYLKEVTYWSKEQVAVARDDLANAIDAFTGLKKDIREYVNRVCQ